MHAKAQEMHDVTTPCSIHKVCTVSVSFSFIFMFQIAKGQLLVLQLWIMLCIALEDSMDLLILRTLACMTLALTNGWELLR